MREERPPSPKRRRMSPNTASMDDLENIWAEIPSSNSSKGGKHDKKERADEEMRVCDASIEEETAAMTTEEIRMRTRMLQNEIQIMKSDIQYVTYENTVKEKAIQRNMKTIKMNQQLPNLVANITEVFEPGTCDEGTESASNDVDGMRQSPTIKPDNRPVAIKTSTKEAIFLPVSGLADPKTLKPGDLVAAHKDTYLIFEKLPDEFDRRVKAFELDERPTDCYSDMAGVDAQIQELIEAVVLPMTHRDMFRAVGVEAPKGVLLYGPPGTGKTLLARACANQTDALFLKLAGPELVQMYIGDGAKLIRGTFELAKKKLANGEKDGAIIFIDEIDAIGMKRHGGDQSGDREVQRTLVELLSQMDGFTCTDNIKVICATNRPDILDPALIRSGRIDRKIELPMPDEDARAKILKIHSRRMNVSPEVNFEELARSSEDYNGAQLKVACVEAGMLALRREAQQICHEDFVEALYIVAMRKKKTMDYFV